MKVYFIGAGPGDPGLLTLKGKKVIEKADIIIYAGSLTSKNILKLAKKGAEIYDSAGMTLDDIFELFREAKSTDKVIARIHSGDPSIYGATQEQMDWCEDEKIDYEVIPGVSSFAAACASLKQELTLPGVSQTVILTRISGRTEVPKNEDLGELAKIGSTMVIFLSVQEIDRVVESLKAGYSLATPVAVVERASWPDEKKVIGCLHDIAAKVKDAGIKSQALIIVGHILEKDYQRSRLYDKHFEHSFRKKRI